MLIPMNQVQNIAKQMGIPQFKGVIHVGACGGEEIQSYFDSGIQNIIWVEGNKYLMKVLYDNTKMYHVKQQYVCEVLSDVDNEKVVFNITNNLQSSSILPFGTHQIYYPHIIITEKREVRTKRFDTFYFENRAMIPMEDFDFINIDVQGAELKVLKGFGDLFKKYTNIHALYLEVNEESLYKDACLIDEINSYIGAMGFVQIAIRMTQFHWGDALYVRK